MPARDDCHAAPGLESHNASVVLDPSLGLPASWSIGSSIAELETPCWLVDREIMRRNLRRMADAAASVGVRVRPHIKTHKIPAIAQEHIRLGAAGIAVAKASEAAVMAAAGIDDIMIRIVSGVRGKLGPAGAGSRSWPAGRAGAFRIRSR